MSAKNETNFCPICRKTIKKALRTFFPFCSERCKFLDLGAWLGEEYRIQNKPGLDYLGKIEN